MKFKNYCIIVLGNVDNVKEEISQISETAVRYSDAKGIVIATFSTVATAIELREFFTLNKRSFLLFEMGEDNYGVNITNSAIHEHLFGEIEQRGVQFLETLSEKLINEIQSTLSNPISSISGGSENEVAISGKVEVNQLDSVDFNLLSIGEREEMVNTLLDKGFENLSSDDLKLLKKLSKKPKK